MLFSHLPSFAATATTSSAIWRRKVLACVRVLAAWLVLAQVLLPVLGHIHAQVHNSARAAGAEVTSVAEGGTVLPDLFGAHSKLDCQTFDHQASGQPLASPLLTLPVVAYAAVMVAALYALLLRQSPALYFARGPPR
ncbi:MAG: hypothetical protein RSD82_07560 [Comamonas sp.]